MSPAEDRRRSARVVAEFPLTLLDDQGGALDDRALARELTDAGFKVESRVELKAGQVVSFRLSLGEEGEVKGRARIAWSERTDLSCWSGGRFEKMPWGDRRRIRRAVSSSKLNWDLMADKAIRALSLMLITAIAWILLSNTTSRGVVVHLIPTAIALALMGWALCRLLQR